jgi:hypothetical protein
MSDENEGGAQEAPTGTPLDGLRAEFAKKLEPKRLRKRFPKEGAVKLVGEYKVAPKAEVRAAAEAQNDEYLLSECLVGILVEDPKHADADKDGCVPLGQWAGQPELDPLGFDQRLCKLLGLPPLPYEQVALKLYEDNDLLLAVHAGEVAEWSTDTTNQAYADFPLAA